MALRVVRLGSPRARDEGLRLGTVRRPPRGVPKSEFASRNFYDVWLPDLAPSEALLKQGLADRSARSAQRWSTFVKRYQREMRAPEKVRLLSLLAALSHQTSLSVGCYCEDEAHCHRSVLRDLLRELGADIVAS